MGRSFLLWVHGMERKLPLKRHVPQKRACRHEMSSLTDLDAGIHVPPLPLTFSHRWSTTCLCMQDAETELHRSQLSCRH